MDEPNTIRVMPSGDKPSGADGQELVTAAQAAEILGFTRQAVINRVKDGRLVPASKLPTATGAYLFRRADVDALLPEPTEATS